MELSEEISDRNLPKSAHLDLSEEFPIVAEDVKVWVEVLIHNQAKVAFQNFNVIPTKPHANCA